MKVCPAHGPLGVGSQDRFCWQCGVAVTEAQTTECACGRRLDILDKFCPACGTKVVRPLGEVPEPAP